MHPDVDAAVFETARGGMLREGLGFDRCEVAVVTNIGSGDHLGLNYITTVEDLAVLKRVIVQNVAPNGYAVLNAADPIVAAMAATCPGDVIFFAADRHHPVMATHRAQGKRAVYVDGNAIVAAEGAWRERLPLAEHAADARRHHRLPGRKRDGRRRRRLGASAWTGTPSSAAWPASSTTPTTRPAAST